MLTYTTIKPHHVFSEMVITVDVNRDQSVDLSVKMGDTTMFFKIEELDEIHRIAHAAPGAAKAFNPTTRED